MKQAVETAFSDLIFTGYTKSKAEGGLKDDSYRFIKTVLTNMAGKGSLDGVFHCSIAVLNDGCSLQCLWMHLLHLHSHHLAFSTSSQLCAHTKRIDKTSDECRLTTKARVSYNQKIFKLGLFLCLHLLEVARPITKAIA